VAEYLYAGADLTVFPSFCATLCGLFYECERSVAKGCDYLNLGGLPGTFDDGLYDFKAPFNPIIVEYAGEFDLPVCGWKYAFMERWLPTLKRIYRMLRR
jgi:serine/alanine adding enzyme